MRDLSRPLEISLVLLLEDLEPFGSVAWQAIQDARALYQVEGGWIEVSEAGSSEVRVAPQVEPVFLGREDLPGVRSQLPPERVAELLWQVGEHVPVSKGAPRRGAAGSVDPMALVGFVGRAVDASGMCVVVHDRPITPPQDQRYAIWSQVPGGVAVSLATLDPLYWGEKTSEDGRRGAVRQRLRAALCSVLGVAIGMIRCDNPTCFLFANVDRVTRLDDMVRIGEEHRAPDLAGRGFTSDVDDADSEPRE